LTCRKHSPARPIRGFPCRLAEAAVHMRPQCARICPGTTCQREGNGQPTTVGPSHVKHPTPPSRQPSEALRRRLHHATNGTRKARGRVAPSGRSGRLGTAVGLQRPTGPAPTAPGDAAGDDPDVGALGHIAKSIDGAARLARNGAGSSCRGYPTVKPPRPSRCSDSSDMADAASTAATTALLATSALSSPS